MFVVYKREVIEAKRERLLLRITFFIIGNVPLDMTHA